MLRALETSENCSGVSSVKTMISPIRISPIHELEPAISRPHHGLGRSGGSSAALVLDRRSLPAPPRGTCWRPSSPTTTSSIETSCGRSRATRRPSRRTSIRSATSNTSGRLWLISTTERPCSRTRLIWSSTLRVCTTPSAAVGSSMNTTLFAQVTARQIAMPWRWPPDMLATGAPVSWIRTPRSRNASSLRRRIARLSRKPNLPSSPARGSSRPRNMFAAGSSSDASDRSW